MSLSCSVARHLYDHKGDRDCLATYPQCLSCPSQIKVSMIYVIGLYPMLKICVDQAKHPRNEDKQVESEYLRELRRNLTSLGGERYVEYMNQIGWSREGMFYDFLSSSDYPFSQNDEGRMTARGGYGRVAHALAVQIFEQ